ncbi:hypothetical protein BT96DRAFT_1101863 [Gymnopus androsaceus JB14]|uniref:Uncharacterized protein n=1 Tax=Gymnopus androsaceus JB14 TaxID=1447944 RepID=A0A6A4GET9_9AGAR|nr:hypothetical protein BT96DRAFT_1101863 [Gymnopus androsaceus JB14]
MDYLVPCTCSANVPFSTEIQVDLSGFAQCHGRRKLRPAGCHSILFAFILVNARRFPSSLAAILLCKFNITFALYIKIEFTNGMSMRYTSRALREIFAMVEKAQIGILLVVKVGALYNERRLDETRNAQRGGPNWGSLCVYGRYCWGNMADRVKSKDASVFYMPKENLHRVPSKTQAARINLPLERQVFKNHLKLGIGEVDTPVSFERVHPEHI